MEPELLSAEEEAKSGKSSQGEKYPDLFFKAIFKEVEPASAEALKHEIVICRKPQVTIICPLRGVFFYLHASHPDLQGGTILNKRCSQTCT